MDPSELPSPYDIPGGTAGFDDADGRSGFPGSVPMYPPPPHHHLPYHHPVPLVEADRYAVNYGVHPAAHSAAHHGVNHSLVVNVDEDDEEEEGEEEEAARRRDADVAGRAEAQITEASRYEIPQNAVSPFEASQLQPYGFRSEYGVRSEYGSHGASDPHSGPIAGVHHPHFLYTHPPYMHIPFHAHPNAGSPGPMPLPYHPSRSLVTSYNAGYHHHGPPAPPPAHVMHPGPLDPVMGIHHHGTMEHPESLEHHHGSMEQASGSYGEIGMSHHYHHHHHQHHHHHHHHHPGVGGMMGLDPWPARLPPQMAPQMAPPLPEHLMLESGQECGPDADVALRQERERDVLAAETEAEVVVDAVGYDYIEDEHQAPDQGLVIRQNVQDADEFKQLEMQVESQTNSVEGGAPAQVQGHRYIFEASQKQVQVPGHGYRYAHAHVQRSEQDLYDTEPITEHVSQLIDLEIVMGDAELDDAEIFVEQLAADVANAHAPDVHVAGVQCDALHEDVSVPRYVTGLPDGEANAREAPAVEESGLRKGIAGTQVAPEAAEERVTPEGGSPEFAGEGALVGQDFAAVQGQQNIAVQQQGEAGRRAAVFTVLAADVEAEAGPAVASAAVEVVSSAAAAVAAAEAAVAAAAAEAAAEAVSPPAIVSAAPEAALAEPDVPVIHAPLEDAPIINEPLADAPIADVPVNDVPVHREKVQDGPLVEQSGTSYGRRAASDLQAERVAATHSRADKRAVPLPRADRTRIFDSQAVVAGTVEHAMAVAGREKSAVVAARDMEQSAVAASQSTGAGLACAVERTPESARPESGTGDGSERGGEEGAEGVAPAVAEEAMAVSAAPRREGLRTAAVVGVEGRLALDRGAAAPTAAAGATEATSRAEVAVGVTAAMVGTERVMGVMVPVALPAATPLAVAAAAAPAPPPVAASAPAAEAAAAASPAAASPAAAAPPPPTSPAAAAAAAPPPPTPLSPPAEAPEAVPLPAAAAAAAAATLSSIPAPATPAAAMAATATAAPVVVPLSSAPTGVSLTLHTTSALAPLPAPAAATAVTVATVAPLPAPAAATAATVATVAPVPAPAAATAATVATVAPVPAPAAATAATVATVAPVPAPVAATVMAAAAAAPAARSPLPAPAAPVAATAAAVLVVAPLSTAPMVMTSTLEETSTAATLLPLAAPPAPPAAMAAMVGPVLAPAAATAAAAPAVAPLSTAPMVVTFPLDKAVVEVPSLTTAVPSLTTAVPSLTTAVPSLTAPKARGAVAPKATAAARAKAVTKVKAAAGSMATAGVVSARQEGGGGGGAAAAAGGISALGKSAAAMVARAGPAPQVGGICISAQGRFAAAAVANAAAPQVTLAAGTLSGTVSSPSGAVSTAAWPVSTAHGTVSSAAGTVSSAIATVPGQKMTPEELEIDMRDFLSNRARWGQVEKGGASIAHLRIYLRGLRREGDPKLEHLQDMFLAHGLTLEDIKLEMLSVVQLFATLVSPVRTGAKNKPKLLTIIATSEPWNRPHAMEKRLAAAAITGPVPGLPPELAAAAAAQVRVGEEEVRRYGGMLERFLGSPREWNLVDHRGEFQFNAIFAFLRKAHVCEPLLLQHYQGLFFAHFLTLYDLRACKKWVLMLLALLLGFSGRLDELKKKDLVQAIASTDAWKEYDTRREAGQNNMPNGREDPSGAGEGLESVRPLGVGVERFQTDGALEMDEGSRAAGAIVYNATVPAVNGATSRKRSAPGRIRPIKCARLLPASRQDRSAFLVRVRQVGEEELGGVLRQFLEDPKNWACALKGGVVVTRLGKFIREMAEKDPKMLEPYQQAFFAHGIGLDELRREKRTALELFAYLLGVTGNMRAWKKHRLLKIISDMPAWQIHVTRLAEMGGGAVALAPVANGSAFESTQEQVNEGEGVGVVESAGIKVALARVTNDACVAATRPSVASGLKHVAEAEAAPDAVAAAPAVAAAAPAVAPVAAVGNGAAGASVASVAAAAAAAAAVAPAVQDGSATAGISAAAAAARFLPTVAEIVPMVWSVAGEFMPSVAAGSVPAVAEPGATGGSAVAAVAEAGAAEAAGQGGGSRDKGRRWIL
ncbi:hypothetical protein CLOM_g17449 [Closterium sp. NIES-68]|nr:hypothetical protein CLOM_g17449 [Closterium sp. NIES-68]